MLCFFVALGARITAAPTRGNPWYTHVWAIGWLLMVLHAIAAFAFHYHWNHAFAVSETARQTKELLGTEVGIGLYVNYVFLVAWGLDVLFAYLPRFRNGPMRTYPRNAILVFLLFIVFNGLVVFKENWLRYAGIAAFAILLAVWYIYRRSRIIPQEPN